MYTIYCKIDFLDNERWYITHDEKETENAWKSLDFITFHEFMIGDRNDVPIRLDADVPERYSNKLWVPKNNLELINKILEKVDKCELAKDLITQTEYARIKNEYEIKERAEKELTALAEEYHRRIREIKDRRNDELYQNKRKTNEDAILCDIEDEFVSRKNSCRTCKFFNKDLNICSR